MEVEGRCAGEIQSRVSISSLALAELLYTSTGQTPGQVGREMTHVQGAVECAGGVPYGWPEGQVAPTSDLDNTSLDHLNDV